MSDTPGTPTASALAPLRNTTFREIWIASIASNFGGLIQAVGAAWLMTSITSSAAMVAMVQASTSLPIMLFSLTSGAIADNFNRRRVMLVAQCFMLTVSVGLTVCAYFGLLTPWLLLSFTFLIGCGIALNNPSWQASVGDIVPRNDISAAVLLNSVGFNLTRSVGPAIGGAIVAAGGAAAAFAVNTCSYLALIFVLLRWRQPDQPSTLPRETLGSAMSAGLRYVAMSPNIEKVLLRSFIFGFSAISILALLPLVARDLLGGGPLTYGVLLGCFGIGAIGGAFLSARLRQRLSAEWIVRMAFLAFALCALSLSFSASLWQAGPSLMVGGAAWVMALSLFNVTVQMSTPRWVVGRALAIYQTATFGGMAVGAWLWGQLAENFGPDRALLISAALLVIGAIVGLKFALPRETTLNLDPLNAWREPALALELKPRSGPILVMVEFIIKEEDTEAFLEAMSERRRVRSRNGARNWTLCRDMENAESWMESYHLPTWVEYRRHNLRTTHADAVVGAKLRALHSGPEGPKVHRMIERPTNWSDAIFATKGVFEMH
ncbi:MFS transporter [Mesorhizobium sp. NBSH29]|uniref:MFS transporter n=1 Tax=Mesorhizobium sp. NBSH29 TaxID=2654249 RepID=UPI001896504A|nr:MFS transporter [Mesorhizobium sp. NBSH29]QPC87498.1 MFS transporter [Mesorhizobium sp. NBSH29]